MNCIFQIFLLPLSLVISLHFLAKVIYLSDTYIKNNEQVAIPPYTFHTFRLFFCSFLYNEKPQKINVLCGFVINDYRF